MTQIQKLQALVEKFCTEREWDQFHQPKDLAIGIAIESAELLELFRFKSHHEIELQMKESAFIQKVENELGDLFFLLLRFAQFNRIDLNQALSNKIKINADKYPIATARGSNKKYNEV